MRNLVVHIGLPKTGTTSIQSTLFANRAALLEQGILYPQAGTISSGGHLNLAWESLGDWKFNPKRGAWADVVKEVRDAGASNVFLSAETFGGYIDRDGIIRDIRKFAQEIDAKPRIVGCAREQVSHMESVYAQSASTGFEFRRFDAFVMQSLLDRRFDLEAVFGRWFEAFDDVRLFEYAPGSGKDVLSRLLEKAGFDALKLEAQERRLNQRVGVRSVEYVRYATEALRQVDGLDKKVKHRLARCLKEICMERFPDDPKFTGFDDALRRRVQDHFNHMNRSFDQARLGGVGFLQEAVKPGSGPRTALDLERASPRERKTFFALYTSALASALGVDLPA